MKDQLNIKVIAWITSAILFLYLGGRVFFNQPLYDELMTFYFYIYQGNFWGESIQLDANNHLLNSAINHWLYPVFTTQFWGYRLLNWFCFLPFCIGIYRLVRNLHSIPVRWVGFIALVSVPFYLEYFAYSRGYGISMGFFALALAHVQSYFLTHKTRYLWFFTLCLCIALLANLVFLTVGLMLWGLIILHSILQPRKSIKTYIPLALTFLLYLVLMTPLLTYAFELKDAGALYYGSLDGLWAVTGKSLMKHVFFLEETIGMWVCLALMVGIAISTISLLTTHLPWRDFTFSHFLHFLFWGYILSIVLMAKIMDVHYPEDRVAFPLLLVGLLVIIDTINRLQNRWKWTYLPLFFFPLSFLFTANFHTSNFSPDDRILPDFYQKVKSNLQPESSLMIYHILRYPWAWAENKNEVKSTKADVYNPNTTFADVIVTKRNFVKNPQIPQLYDTLALSREGSYIAYKRKEPLLRQEIMHSAPVNGKGTFEYFDLWKVDSLDLKANAPYLVSARGILQCFDQKNTLDMVLALTNSKGELVWYEFHPFEQTFVGRPFKNQFQLQFLVDKFPADAKSMKVYLWSRTKDRIEVSDAKCYLYKLNPNQTNGTR